MDSPVFAKEDAPNIMIIHSYDLCYQWTSGQDEGIRTTILEHYPTANIYTENLDSKRISEAYIMSTQKDVFVDKYANIDFDLMLATEQNSLEKLFDNEYNMINAIEHGIENDEFYLVFQPIMTLDGSQVHSFEALLRWNSSCYGAVSPSEFIPIAETGGQILELGDKVIDMAIDFIKMLQKNQQKVSTVSINISVVQFYEADFVSNLLAKLKHHLINNAMIQLEIIESLMIHSYEMIRSKLDELKANNITVALDDFGTGYSSLSHISKLPIDIVKIDKQFIDDILEDKEGKLIIDTICTLTKSLSLKTIAEGVETVEQLDYIKKCGCDFIQGYYYSKPLMADDALIFIKKHQQSQKML